MLHELIHSDTLAARAARRLVPAALLVMPVLGVLRYAGEVGGLYEAPTGVGLMVAAGVLVLLGVSWWTLSLIRRSEQAREASEQQLDRFFDLSPDMFVVAGFDGRFHRLNDSWKTTLGYDLAELTSRPFLDFVHPDDQTSTVAAFQHLLDGQDVISFENRYLAGDGSIRWLQWSCRSHPAESLIQCVARDVTEARYAAAALASNAEEIRDLYEHAPVGYHSVDADGLFVRVNATELAWLGYEAAELVGKRRFTDLLTPASQDTVRALMPEAETTGELRDLELDFIRKDGSVLCASVSSSTVRDAAGAFVMSRTTLVDVTARRAAEAERERAREEAQRANLAKSEFLSRMSHELRTPMNSVLGFAQLLARDEGLTTDQRENVRYITSGGRHLLQLIDEVLDIARIEAGRLTISAEPVAVCEIIEDSVALIRPLADERRITITVGEAQCSQHVQADRQRLKQVLLNLLSNAVKYNREAGAVRVTCEVASPGRFRISVADTGTGIAAAHLDRLFTPFDRLDAEHSGVEGTGIGLTLSKGLMEAMSGTIGVASRPGEGATFWLELDLVDDPAEQVQRATPRLDPATAVVDARSILYIEDNLANVKLIERILTHRPGVRLLTAMQGRLGLQLARQHRPDLVLLDLHLPDLPGQDVLHQLRTAPETADIPVAIVSADATPGQIRRLLSAGATHYLAKPIDVGELLTVVDSAVAADDQVVA